MINKIKIITGKIISCVKERRLPWVITSKFCPPAGGESRDITDAIVEGRIRQINPATIVDFGAGKGKYGKMVKNIRRHIHTTAVEIDKKTAWYLRIHLIYNKVVRRDILGWLRKNHRIYDLAIFGDVLEHLCKDDIYAVVNLALKYFKNILIIVPVGEEKQGPIDGNVYETHLTIITEDFFERFNIIDKVLKEVTDEPNLHKMVVWIKGK
jgi:hypothetical protein